MAGFYGPARDKEDLMEVRCRGCKRKMGVAHGHPMHKLYCSEICAQDHPVLDNTERDDVLEVLVRMKGWTANRIALELDISRQRAHQILQERFLAGTAS